MKRGAEADADLQEEILLDLAQNLEKINFHGKRADAIVKSMLQHSWPMRDSRNQPILMRLQTNIYAYPITA